jgi:hypothetical protein
LVSFLCKIEPEETMLVLEILSLMAKDEAKEEEELSVRKSVYG